MDPREQTIVYNKMNRRKSYFNQDDPFYKRKVYSKLNNEVYKTEQVLGIISPKNHRNLQNASHLEIKQNSLDRINKYCDKQKQFAKDIKTLKVGVDGPKKVNEREVENKTLCQLFDMHRAIK